MIQALFTDIIRVKALRDTGTENQARYIATATADASIQPLGKDRHQIDEGQFGSKFIAYLDPEVSIKEGDKVVDQNERHYIVEHVVKRDTGGLLQHQELILTRTKN